MTNFKLLFFILLALSGVLSGCSTNTSQCEPASLTGIENNSKLTKKVSHILIECQAIKPGMTRADLLKVFTTEGGLSTVQHQTFVYRGCPYIKVDVDFTPADTSLNRPEEQPADTISKISKPYLEWSIID